MLYCSMVWVIVVGGNSTTSSYIGHARVKCGKALIVHFIFVILVIIICGFPGLEFPKLSFLNVGLVEKQPAG